MRPTGRAATGTRSCRASGPARSTPIRARGPWAPAAGVRFDDRLVLLDPYGRGVAVPPGYARDLSPAAPDAIGRAMKSVVVDLSALRLGGRPPARPAAPRHGHLRGARPRLHGAPELGRRRRAARHVRRVHRADPVPRRPRRHRGRAAAGLPVRSAGRARRPAELLGLPAGLATSRPTRRTAAGPTRSAPSTSSATSSRRSTGPASRSSSTSSTTTPPRAAPTARRSASAASPTRTYYLLDGRRRLRRLQRLRQHAQRQRSRSCAGSSSTACATGSRRCTSTASASTSRRSCHATRTASRWRDRRSCGTSTATRCWPGRS